MMKLGVGSAPKIVNDQSNVQVLPTVKVLEEKEDKKTEIATNSKAEPKTTAVNKPIKYSKWPSVVERIGELKCSLSVQFVKSVAYLMPDGTYLIRMNSFFAKKLSGSDADLSILRGIIAEKEAVPTEQVRIVIEPLDTSSIGDYSDEIANNIGAADVLF